jgi:hypothetical protein
VQRLNMPFQAWYVRVPPPAAYPWLRDTHESKRDVAPSQRTIDVRRVARAAIRTERRLWPPPQKRPSGRDVWGGGRGGCTSSRRSTSASTAWAGVGHDAALDDPLQAVRFGASDPADVLIASWNARPSLITQPGVRGIVSRWRSWYDDGLSAVAAAAPLPGDPQRFQAQTKHLERAVGGGGSAAPSGP